MSLNLNKVTFAGNLTRNPELKFLAGEKAVCEFGMASNRKWKDKDGTMKEEATFAEIVAWGRTAELVTQYLTKGSPAYVEGRLTQETWEDKETGKKRSKTRITAETVQFLGSKQERSGEEQSAAPAPSPRRPAAPSGGGSSEDEGPPFMRRCEWE